MKTLDEVLAEMERVARDVEATSDYDGYVMQAQATIRLVAAIRVLDAAYDEADENDGAKQDARDRACAILTGATPP